MRMFHSDKDIYYCPPATGVKFLYSRNLFINLMWVDYFFITLLLLTINSYITHFGFEVSLFFHVQNFTVIEIITVNQRFVYLFTDYAIATERMCLPMPPQDQEQRCTPTLYLNKKVLMCFCKGDLCNTATVPAIHIVVVLACVIGHLFKMNRL